MEKYTHFLEGTGTHLTYAALSTYLNGSEELSRKEREFLETHLASCDECRSRLGEVRDVEEMEPSRSTFTIRRYAIAAVFVIAIGGVTLFFLRDRAHEDVAQNPQPVGVPLAAADPARFAPNAVLDGFVGRTLRSGGTAAILSPHPGDTVTTPIRFTWSPGHGPYVLICTDNTNADLLTVATEHALAVVDTALAPGLYYAKLRDAGNLASVTRFVVLQQR